MRKFGFTSWYIIIAATLMTACVDYYSVSTIQNFGGFSAWQNANPFWDAAIAYSFVWHFFYAITIAMVFLCNKDEL